MKASSASAPPDPPHIHVTQAATLLSHANPLPNPQVKPGDIPTLTGVRAFASWWVVFFHSAFLLPVSLPALYWFVRLGYLGVDLFFVLSGFIISYNYWNRLAPFSAGAYRGFLWLRLARLYPVHLFTLLLSALLLLGVRVSGAAYTKDFSTWTLPNFLANAAMVHAWRLHYVESWNNASWSISCEWFAYLLFPLLVISQLNKLPARLALTAAVLLPAIYASCAQAGFPLPFALLIKVITEFAAGSLVYHVYARSQTAPRSTWLFTSSVALASVLAIAALAIFHTLSPDWLALLFPLLILAVARSSGPLRAFLGSRPLVYWGKVSYSLYMTHNVTLWLLKALLPIRRPGPPLLVSVTYIVCIALAAVLTYHVVEEPARKWMRSLRAGRRSQPRGLPSNQDTATAAITSD